MTAKEAEKGRRANEDGILWRRRERREDGQGGDLRWKEPLQEDLGLDDLVRVLKTLVELG